MTTAPVNFRPHPRSLLLVFILLVGCSEEKMAERQKSNAQAPLTTQASAIAVPNQDLVTDAAASSFNADSVLPPLNDEELRLPTDIAVNENAVPPAIPTLFSMEFPDVNEGDTARADSSSISMPRRRSRVGNLRQPGRFPAISSPPAASGDLPANSVPPTTSTPFSIVAPFSPASPRAAVGTATEAEPRLPEARSGEFRAARSTTGEGTVAAKMFESPPEMSASTRPMSAHGPDASHRDSKRMAGMPVGTLPTDAGYSKVRVYYATDRQRSHVSLAAYELSGQRTAFMVCCFLSFFCIAYAGVSSLRSRSQAAGIGAMMGCLSGFLAGCLIFLGQTKIEKHGVNYTGDRGQFTHGIAEVSIPESHQRGSVERPSLLRFEVREDQTKHIVLTNAVELLEEDFKLRVSDAVAAAPARDLLVFIHGYNVSFESALLRTAQLAVDLPFEGVPICYSWPSQATLTGYPIDANNADWTVPHLKDFLLDLATQSGADSINVIAHSMGNRAMTAAIRQISQQQNADAKPLFDRIVLAAPDIDADYFRRDAAPALVKVADHVTLYASSDDQALIASRKVNGYPRAGDSGADIVIAPGIETVDVSGTDLSLLGHSYYGDNETMLRDLYDVVRARLPATKRNSLIQRSAGTMIYWQLAQQATAIHR